MKLFKEENCCVFSQLQCNCNASQLEKGLILWLLHPAYAFRYIPTPMFIHLLLCHCIHQQGKHTKHFKADQSTWRPSWSPLGIFFQLFEHSPSLLEWERMEICKTAKNNTFCFSNQTVTGSANILQCLYATQTKHYVKSLCTYLNTS